MWLQLSLVKGVLDDSVDGVCVLFLGEWKKDATEAVV